MLTGNNYRFPDSMTAELAGIDGVQDIYRKRIPRIQFRGNFIMLVVADMDKLAAHSSPPVIEGNPVEMSRMAAAGQGVIGSENFTSLRGLKLGDIVELPAPAGVLRLPLVGIVREYSDQQGELFLDRAPYVKYWNDETIDHYCVFLRPGADPAAVREAILRRFSANRHLFVLTNAQVRNYIAGLAGSWWAITWVQICVAILVAVLGIVNSLTATIADRRRELGVLQALGGLRRQLRIHHLAGGSRYRRDWRGARPLPGSDPSLLFAGDDFPRLSGAAVRIHVSLLDRAPVDSSAPGSRMVLGGRTGGGAVRSSLVEALEYE